jgi:hypothetical protein
MLSKCLVVGSVAFVSLSFLTLSKCIEGSDKGDHIAHPLLYFWPSLSFALSLYSNFVAKTVVILSVPQ